VNDAANEELEKLLAKALGLPRSSVKVIRGRASRDKTVRILDLEPAEVRDRLPVP
jgi:uncharacterized protein YggU (UPF0235/DUF167 family)